MTEKEIARDGKTIRIRGGYQAASGERPPEPTTGSGVHRLMRKEPPSAPTAEVVAQFLALLETATPGPWSYQEESDRYTHIVRAGERQFVCQFPQDLSGRAEADARLIALIRTNAESMLAALQRPAQSTLPQGEAWDAGHNRHYGPVESFAAEIYARCEYAAGRKPDWVPHGNSLKQDEARNIARRQLHDLGHTPGVAEHLRDEAAPGAEAVANELVHELKSLPRPSGESGISGATLLSIDLRDRVITALHQPVPVPAPGVTVTKEMIDCAVKAYHAFLLANKGLDFLEAHAMRAALSAALRPKE